MQSDGTGARVFSASPKMYGQRFDMENTMKNIKHIICIIVPLIVFATMPTGCGGGGIKQTLTTFTQSTTDSGQSQTTGSPEGVVYISADYPDYEDTEIVYIDLLTKSTKSLADSMYIDHLNAREDFDIISYCSADNMYSFSTYEIFVVNRNGTGTEQLTNNTGFIYWPIITSDERIYFKNNTVHEDPEMETDTDIYRINADGTGKTNLTDNTESYIGWFDVAPDQSFLVYNESLANSMKLYLFDLNKQTETELVSHGFYDIGGPISISPDSQYIMYPLDCYIDSFCDELTIIDTSGAIKTQLDQASYYAMIAWAPDGKKFAFSQDNQTDDSMICLYDMDTLSETCIKETAGISYLAQDWSDDGNYILALKISYSEEIADIVYFNTDGSGEIQLTNNSTGKVARFPRFM